MSGKKFSCKSFFLLISIFLLFTDASKAQLKSLIEDFEGFADGQTEMKDEGVFSYGGINLMTLQHITSGYGYSGERALKVQWTGKEWFGGWGVGVGVYKELDVKTDYFNFYLYCPKIDTVAEDKIKIRLEDDDNNDALFDTVNDDSWFYDLPVLKKNEWQLISIALTQFSDDTKGGDGKFDLSFKEGKLLSVYFAFEDISHYTSQHFWYFDFISFSKGKFISQNDIFLLPSADKDDYCALGAWSKTEDDLNYLLVPYDFEKLFNCDPDSTKKLAMVSIYKPFSTDGKNVPNIYPSVEYLNQLVNNGYLPMITLESHYPKADDSIHQPNLYAIMEGHLDYYFADWARRLKEVKSTVFLRVLHEFNGDWYPWCIANNEKNPKLFIKTFQHIRQIFWDEKADNVKFVWCPNSMSVPQESWNYIMDAYPGNEYVDVVGLDIFNGAGVQKENVWHSFRKSAIDNYFIIREKIPDKPFIICETASRERNKSEKGFYEDKAKWIQHQAEALKTDFSKVQMMIWFNQYDNFRINSSVESSAAYLKYFWLDNYFKSK